MQNVAKMDSIFPVSLTLESIILVYTKYACYYGKYFGLQKDKKPHMESKHLNEKAKRKHFTINLYV